ncbi:hypothetical protein GWP85_17115 [Acinetobacter beijerinckii]|uniref:hypothetical protein n=1 Tax=Acinetobacter beijerinckii TaxID=262668 RepID=UPI0023DDCBAF|nr:hypothetical protein [Acinetobacter beijerinckii]MDF2419213.1 hypothetical protein [Acinetobacter beijerinckii]
MQFYDPPILRIKSDLNDEVEKWLKDKSNKITELDFGFSNFPDGKIPYSKAPVQQLDIEKYNAEKVTKHSPVTTETKPKKAKPTKAKIVKKRTPKPKVEKVLKTKIATKLVVYTERAMVRFHNIEVFKVARDNQAKTVEALCINHGYTTYKFFNDRPRCLLCIKADQVKDLESHNRRNTNHRLMMDAIKDDQKKFTGVCKTHGETSFFIIKTETSLTGANYKCCACNSERQIAYKIRKGAAA